MNTTTEQNHAKEQAQAQLESILEMVSELKQAEHCGDDDRMGDAREAIESDALEVLVRSDWYAPGSSPERDGEFQILLCTGGPACRMIGELENGEPVSARLEWQDWGTPWTDYPLNSDERDACIAYAGVFYWGDR